MKGKAKPSQVCCMNGVLPFIGSKFGRAEREFAAALLVRACVAHDDVWAPRSLKEIGLTLRAEMDEGGLFTHLRTNPFAPRPDFRGLVEKGFARFVGDPEDGASIEFTEEGLAALEPFVQRVPS